MIFFNLWDKNSYHQMLCRAPPKSRYPCGSIYSHVIYRTLRVCCRCSTNSYSGAGTGTLSRQIIPNDLLDKRRKAQGRQGEQREKTWSTCYRRGHKLRTDHERVQQLRQVGLENRNNSIDTLPTTFDIFLLNSLQTTQTET